MSRFRSRTVKDEMTSNRTTNYVVKDEDDVTVTSYFNSTRAPVRLSYQYEQMTDEVIAQFVTLRNKGRVFMNSMTSTREIDERSDLHRQNYQLDLLGKYDNNPYVANIDYDIYPREEQLASALSGHAIPALPLGFESSVLTKAIAKAKSASFESLVTAAEFGQTIGLLKTLGQRLLTLKSRTFWKHLSSGAIRSYQLAKSSGSHRAALFTRAVKRASNEWLQYRYGMRQLVFDYENSLALIKALKNPPRKAFIVKDVYTSDEDYTHGPEHFYTNFDERRVSVKRKTRYEVTAGVLVEGRLGDTGHIIDAAGILDIIPAIWDLTRLSFVFDWFVDVGTWLSAINPDVSKVTRGSWLSTRRYVDTDAQFTFGLSPTDTEGTLGSGTYKLVGGNFPTLPEIPRIFKQEVTYSRAANPPTPILPSLIVNLDVAKLADLVALASQFLRR